MSWRLSLLFTCLLLGPAVTFATPLGVVVSVPPQAWIVEQIGGDRVSVSVMLQPGQNETTFAPSPAQMEQVTRANLYVRIGVPFETVALPRLHALNPALEILDARHDLPLQPLDHHHHGTHEQDAQELMDPHVWLSPALVKRMGEQLRERLSELQPQHASDFARGYRRLSQTLDQLDAEIRQLLEPHRGETLLVFHPSWGYFVREYGLLQRSIEVNGKPPGARQLEEIIVQARQNDVRRIFVQPQFDQHRARALAEAIGAEVIELDPLARDYPTNLLRIARRIADIQPPMPDS